MRMIINKRTFSSNKSFIYTSMCLLSEHCSSAIFKAGGARSYCFYIYDDTFLIFPPLTIKVLLLSKSQSLCKGQKQKYYMFLKYSEVAGGAKQE